MEFTWDVDKMARIINAEEAKPIEFAANIRDGFYFDDGLFNFWDKVVNKILSTH